MRQNPPRWVQIAVIILLILFIPVQTATSVYPELWSERRHVALLRLEDVSPGPPYRDWEDMGKLRAVLDGLAEAGVPYQITVIPRYVGTDPGGKPVVYDISEPDAQTARFVQLLREAESRGAVIGMHGYTHQFGTPDARKPETVTTIGREFDVPGEPASRSPEYAALRLNASERAFAAAGLRPAFWESPHYWASPEQERVFQAAVGVIYEPDRSSLRSLKDLVPKDKEFGGVRGSVYIPTPLGYVRSTDPEKSIQRILDKADYFDGLGSFYFHPVLEFPFLEPVEENGRPVWKDGLPLYRYRAGQKSYLHRLIDGLRREGYVFESLHQVVPLQPAWRFSLPGDLWTTGPVSGGAEDDFVSCDSASGTVWVTPSARGRLRNSPQKPASAWLKLPRGLRPDGLAAVDANGDGKADLLLLDTGAGRLYLCLSGGTSFFSPVTLGIPIRKGDRISAGRFAGGRPAVAVLHPSGDADVFALSPPPRRPEYAGSIPGEAGADWLVVPQSRGKSPAEADELARYNPLTGKLSLYRLDGPGKVVSRETYLPPRLQLAALPPDGSGTAAPVLVGYAPADGLWLAWSWNGAECTAVSRPFGPWMASGGRLAAGRWGDGRPCVGVVSAGGGLIVDTAVSYFGWTPAGLHTADHSSEALRAEKSTPR